MINLDSIKFDLTDYTLKQESEFHRAWLSSKIVATLLRFDPDGVSWNFDLSDEKAARSFYDKQCTENGGAPLLIEKDLVHGIEILKGLFKYRAPNNKLAMLFVGIIWIPFQECVFQINVEAMEQGTTGMREAAVMLMKPDNSEEEEQEDFSPPVKVKNAEEMFEMMGSRPLKKIEADDETYDHIFKDHPLSLVRERLNQILETLEFGNDLKNCKPFRI